MSLEPINPDDPRLTAYALGEMSASEATEFEAHLEVSPLAKSELLAMSNLSAMLTTGLKREWVINMGRPVKVDLEDPKYTAFALNELTEAERVEVKAELIASPAAQREMEAMTEIMSMLSTGLKNEWESGLKSPQFEVVPDAATNQSNVVAFKFAQSRRAWIGVAAAAVALLAVGATYFSQPATDQVEVADWGSGSKDASLGISMDVEEGNVTGVASAPGLHVPQLFLAEEVEDISELTLVAVGPAVLDASYLEGAHVPSAHSTGEMQIVPAGFSPASERIDSYLPEASSAVSDFPTRHTRGLTVESFVPRARAETALDRQIRLAAEFQGVQIELEQMLALLPQGSPERRHFELVLERNSRALGELKAQFSE